MAIHFSSKLSGSSATSASLGRLDISGSQTPLSITGASGSLFSVTDNFSGSLMSVSDVSGIPILEVHDDDRVVMGSYSSPALIVTGSISHFNGNVGIGTDAPAGQNANGPILHLFGKNASGTLNEPQLVFQQTGEPAMSIGVNANLDSGAAMLFQTNGSNIRMVMLEGGNIGIGTTSPAGKLDVAGETFISSGRKLRFGTAGSSLATFSTQDGIFWGTSNDSNFGIFKTAGGWSAPNYQQLEVNSFTGIVLNPGSSYGKSYVDVKGNGLRVSSGNIGIGLTNPGDYHADADNLVIYGSGNSGMTIASGTSSHGNIWFADGTGGVGEYQSRIQFNHNGNTLMFAIGDTEVMRFLSSGFVGIGTTNARLPLHVRGGNTSVPALGYPQLLLENHASDYPGLVFKGSSGIHGAIRIENGNGWTFWSAPNGDIDGSISWTNAFRIYENADVDISGTAKIVGNLGIGGAAGQHLDIVKSGARMRLTDSTNQLNIGLWDGSNFRIEGDANRPIFITSYNSTGIKLGISGGQHLTIDGSGHTNIASGKSLSVGTSWAPAGTYGVGRFHGSHNGGGTRVMFSNANSTVRYGIVMHGSDTGTADKLGIGLLMAANGTYSSQYPAMTIDSGKKVGIGTTMPSAQLHIQGGAWNTSLIIQGNAGSSGIKFLDSDSNFDGAVYAVSSMIGFLDPGGDWMIKAVNDSHISFHTNAATEHMRITSAGRVGIGGTTPQYKLDINNGASGIAAHFGGQTSTSNGVIGGISFGYYEAANAYYRKAAIVQSQIGDSSARGHLHFLVDTAADGGSAVLADSKMMIHGTSGNVGIGNTSPSFTLDVSGTGRFTGNVDIQGVLALPAVGDDIHLGNALSTTPKIRFGTSSWGNNYGLESYWSVFSTNSNEGYRFKDSAGTELFRLQGTTSSGGAGIRSANFYGPVVPMTDSSANLGTSGLRWANVHADVYNVDGGHTIKNYGGDLTIESAGDDINIVGSWMRFRGSDGGAVTTVIKSDGSTSIGGPAGNIPSGHKFTVAGRSYFDGAVTASGDLMVYGNVIAQEFHTEFVSASIIMESGSTQFGNSSDDIHKFTGDVGIGTGSPSRTLHIHDASQNFLRISHNTAANGLEIGYDNGGHTNASVYNRYQSNDASKITFGFGTPSSGVVRMTLLKAGYTGIGTASPDSALDVTNVDGVYNKPVLSIRTPTQNKSIKRILKRDFDVTATVTAGNYFRLRIPQTYQTIHTSGGYIKVKVIWQGHHAARSTTQIYRATYHTNHGHSSNQYFGISEFTKIYDQQSPLSYAPYEYTTQPSVSFARLTLSGYGGVRIHVVGGHGSYARYGSIEVEVNGNSDSTPTLENRGTTADAASALDIRDDTAIHVDANDNILMSMPNTTVTKQLASANKQLSFYGEIVAKDGGGAGTYLAMGSAQNSQNYLFSTGNIPLNLSTNSATRMTILGGGNVGIGVTDPDQKLEVNGTIKSTQDLGLQVLVAGSSARIELESNSHWSYTRLKYNGSTSWDIASYQGGDLQFRPAGSGTNAILMTSGGHITLPGGLTTPGTITTSGLISSTKTGQVAKFDSASSVYITMDSSGANWNYINYLKDGSTVWDVGHYNGGNYEIRPAGTNNNRLIYTSAGHLTVTSFATSGKVAVAGATANKTLEVLLNNASTDVTAEGLLGGTAGAGLLIHNTNTTNNNYANLDFRAQDGDARIAVQRTATNTSQMHFVMDNAGTALNAMTIRNDGHLGIGTTSPVMALDIKAGEFEAAASSGNATNGIARFGQASGQGALDIGFHDTSGGYSWLQSRAANNYATNYNLVLQPNGGNVGIGTITPAVRLHTHHTTPSDGSRTTPITMLRLHRTKSGAVEYTGFGSDIEFYGRTYNNSTHRSLGIIRLQLNDDSVNTGRGTSMHFRTHDAPSGTSMSEKFQIGYDGIIVNPSHLDYNFTLYNDAIAAISLDGTAQGAASTHHHGRIGIMTPFNAHNAVVNIGGNINSYFGGGASWGTAIAHTVTAHSSNSAGLYVQTTITGGNTQTNPVLANAFFDTTTWTEGSSNTINLATNVYIAGAPTVTNHSGPSHALHVASGLSYFNGNIQLTPNDKIYVSGNSENSIEYYNGSTGAMKLTAGASGVDYGMEFHQNGSQIMTIKTGRVGIGTSTPGAPLDIESGNDPLLVLNKLSGGNSAIHFQHSGTAKGYIYVDSSMNMHFGNTSVNPTFEINSAGTIYSTAHVSVGGGQIITPSGVNLALNPNTGLVTVANNLTASGTVTGTTAVGVGATFTWTPVSGTSYVQPSSWIRVNTVGLYTGTNGAHIYPNQASDFGVWRINGTRNGWNGITFDTGGVYNTLMSNGSTMGMYNDHENEWMLECTRNGTVRLYYDAVIRVETTSVGVKVVGNLRVDGGGNASDPLITTNSDTNTGIYFPGSGKVGVGGSGGLEVENGATFGGKISATSKAFLIDHPTKKGKKLQHGSLEGPENGVYVRGKCESNVIELPDYWTGLVDEDTITVQLTPIGGWQKLYVKKIEDNKVYVGKFGFGSPKFFYNVYGERKDIDKLEVEY